MLLEKKPQETKMANSDIKILYFDMTGRAEMLRLLLTVAGKKFDDVRFERGKWQTIKPSTPFGQAPVLELDGKMYGQSWAIASFLASEFGLYGKTNLDRLQIDQISGLTEDFFKCFAKTFGETDEAKKAELQKKVKEEDTPRFLGFYEKLLKENGTGYFVGSSLSLADIVLFDVCTGFLKAYVEDSLDKFPLVKALVDKVGSNDKIKPYVAARK